MKHQIQFILIAAMAAAAALTGCSTTSGSSGTSSAINVVTLRDVAEVATVADLSSRPTDRPYFAAAVVALDVLANNGQANATNVVAALQGVQVSGVNSAEIVVALQVVTDEYAQYAQNQGGTNSLSAGALALEQGIQTGLQLVPATK